MAYTTTTNLSLQKPVSESRIVEDVPNLKASHSANMDIIEKSLSGTTTIGTNASIVATGGNRIVRLYACSAGSISTISGALIDCPFTLMMMSSGASLALIDDDTAGTSARVLTADWVPATIYSALTLVWDGTRYIELGRATAA